LILLVGLLPDGLSLAGPVSPALLGCVGAYAATSSMTVAQFFSPKVRCWMSCAAVGSGHGLCWRLFGLPSPLWIKRSFLLRPQPHFDHSSCKLTPDTVARLRRTPVIFSGCGPSLTCAVVLQLTSCLGQISEAGGHFFRDPEVRFAIEDLLVRPMRVNLPTGCSFISSVPIVARTF